MSTKKIAFINFKGGVGKTASVVNIGASLAKYQDKKVLIVDLDAQSNSSLWLLQPQQWKEHVGKLGRHSTYQIFQDAIQDQTHFHFEKAVVKGVPKPLENFTLIPGLDLLPASINLIKVEDAIHQAAGRQYYRYLYQALENYYNNYDYVLFDCPPNLYSLTRNALFSADFCLVPYIPDFLSLSGFQVLAEEILHFRNKVSSQLKERKGPRIAALLISHFRAVGNVFAQAINELELALSGLKAAGLVHAKADILTPNIRHCVGIAESTNEHLPALLHKPACIGAQDYAELSVNFDKHFQSIH